MACFFESKGLRPTKKAKVRVWIEYIRAITSNEELTQIISQARNNKFLVIIVHSHMRHNTSNNHVFYTNNKDKYITLNKGQKCSECDDSITNVIVEESEFC